MKIYNSLDYVNEVLVEKKPAMRYDGTLPFGEWQQKARKKLEELLGLPFERCEDQFSIVDQFECCRW